MTRIPFTKMHGCGNDYIYVNAMLHPIKDPAAAARLWSDRHKGIGSDGLVLIDRSPVPEADFSMRIFNADGSEAMMCGNASRCIGKYLYERGITTQTQIRLLTLSGVKVLELHVSGSAVVTDPTPNPSPTGVGNTAALPSPTGAGNTAALPSLQGEGSGVGSVTSVTVDMGEPVFEDESQFIPNRGLTMGVFVSMGNPHYVIFTDNVDQVGETGRALENHLAFPQRCNIEFVAPLSCVPSVASDQKSSATPDGGTIGPAQKTNEAPSGAVGGAFRVRVWERGSGITQACGTGACATAVAAAITGRAGRKSTIVMDGGTLCIEWRESDNHVYMTGPAEFVFDGEIEAI